MGGTSWREAAESLRVQRLAPAVSQPPAQARCRPHRHDGRFRRADRLIEEQRVGADVEVHAFGGELLPDRERVLGLDHTDTQTTRTIIASGQGDRRVRAHPTGPHSLIEDPLANPEQPSWALTERPIKSAASKSRLARNARW